MTTEEIVKEYKKRFILIIETKGEELDNSVYKNVEKVLSEENLVEFEKKEIIGDAPLEFFISTYIMALLVAMYGADKLSGEFLQEREEYKYIYEHYLKDMTNKFTSQYGLPQVNMKRIGLMVLKIEL